MPIINLDPAKLRFSLSGRKELNTYEKLRKYYSLNQLRDLCSAFQLEHNPKATRSDLALLITQKKPDFKLSKK
jgi:hypothetical protein